MALISNKACTFLLHFEKLNTSDSNIIFVNTHFSEKLEEIAKNEGKSLILILAYHQKLSDPSFQSELAHLALLHFVMFNDPDYNS